MRSIFLAVLWAFLYCIVISVNGQPIRENPKVGKAKPANSQPIKIDAISVDTINVTKLNVQQEKPTGKPDSDKQESKSYFSRLFAPENISNWILCIVGIAGIITAVCSLKVIQQQAHWMKKQTEILVQYNKSTRETADAALLNAQAVINSDRPWIYIMAAHSSSSGAYAFHAGNDGNTPAEVVSYSCGFKCVDSISDLPTEPEYGPDHAPLISLLVAKVHDLDGMLELMSFNEFAAKFSSCGKTLDAIQHALMTGPKLSVFYFRVIYASALKKAGADIPNYETRMCFCFSPSTSAGEKPFRVCGNGNYNRHT